jgi:hypothetical protein
MISPRSIAFKHIADVALGRAESIVQRWLPDGKRDGAEWVAINPMRADSRKGSFKINLKTGRWGDFATGDLGGDLISLAAYLNRINNAAAALRVAEMLGINPHDQ